MSTEINALPSLDLLGNIKAKYTAAFATAAHDTVLPDANRHSSPSLKENINPSKAFGDSIHAFVESTQPKINSAQKFQPSNTPSLFRTTLNASQQEHADKVTITKDTLGKIQKMIHEFNEKAKIQEYEIQALSKSLSEAKHREDALKKASNDTCAKLQHQISRLNDKIIELKQSLVKANLNGSAHDQEQRRVMELDLYKEKIKTKKFSEQQQELNATIFGLHKEKAQILNANTKLKGLLKIMITEQSVSS